MNGSPHCHSTIHFSYYSREDDTDDDDDVADGVADHREKCIWNRLFRLHFADVIIAFKIQSFTIIAHRFRIHIGIIVGPEKIGWRIICVGDLPIVQWFSIHGGRTFFFLPMFVCYRSHFGLRFILFLFFTTITMGIYKYNTYTNQNYTWHKCAVLSPSTKEFAASRLG